MQESRNFECQDYGRRRFLQSCAVAAAGTTVDWQSLAAQESGRPPAAPVEGATDASAAVAATEAVTDIHQHVHYHGRPNDVFLRHQDAMGIRRTVLLPAGTVVTRGTTHEGRSNGLAARILGNEAALVLARRHPERFVFFANEVPDLEGAAAEIERYLALGAVGIGEQKFNIDCDSKEMRRVFDLARDFRVPVLLHFQHGAYNHGLDRFHKVLEAYPEVNFIGHAQTWWGHIDLHHDPGDLYPKGPVTPGGITDRLLADYPNMFGDLSAGSGLNAFTRDEDHGAGFLLRHQDKLLYGSDCADAEGAGEPCSGAQMLALVRRLVPDPAVRGKILSANAARVIRLADPKPGTA